MNHGTLGDIHGLAQAIARADLPTTVVVSEGPAPAGAGSKPIDVRLPPPIPRMRVPTGLGVYSYLLAECESRPGLPAVRG